MDLQKNSVIANHLAQISRDKYDMKSIQYGNTPSSANLNAPGAKTGVPTKKSMPVSVDKGCLTHDSLHLLGTMARPFHTFGAIPPPMKQRNNM